MILDATCDMTYTNPGEVPAIFMLRPRSGWAQWIMQDSYRVSPKTQIVEFDDLYGNLCQRLIMPAGDFSISVKVRADVPDHVNVQCDAPVQSAAALPTDVLHYLLPSRYCQSDQMSQLAGQIIGTNTHKYENVEAIRAWIHDNIKYQYGTSNSSTTAQDTANSRIGVCRDYAHLGIALSRSINVPARMVVGFLHLLDPMDLHAWFEAYINGRWWAFDATQENPRGNRIVIAYGRDAADVALCTSFAPSQFKSLKVTVTPAPLDEL